MNRIDFSFKRLLFLCCCISLLFVQRVKSQDFHLSQFDAFSQYLNPAMTGMFNGDFRANFHFRTQWKSIVPNPFVTTGVGFDVPKLNALSATKLRNLKLGAYVINQRAGASKFNIFNFALSGAYDWAVKNSDHHAVGGMQLGFINKSVSLNDLYFQSQYNNQNGGSFNSNNSSNEVLSNANVFLPELNAGIMYYYGKVQSRLNPFIGGSVFHATQPKENFFNTGTSADNRLNRRYAINGGSKINITRLHQANLHALYMQQANVREIQGCIMGMSFLKGRDDICLLYGYAYRKLNNEDAQIIHLGMKYQDFTCRVSYDINVSTLNNFSNGRGGFEISLVYVRSKPVIIPAVTCPRI